MKKLFLSSIGLLIFCLLFLSASALQEPDGKAVFLAQKCNLCHSVTTAGIEATAKSEKIKGPDLVNLADKYKSDWIIKYLKREVKKDDKIHKKQFAGSDEELKALVDWLLKQKKG